MLRAATLLILTASSLMPVQAQDAPLMMLPGQFDVSPTGAATYSIPIAVPPGTAGMVPSLSLEYSSQSGDGVMGLGWSLAGLPSIGRCPRTVAQDGVKGSVNYNADDRFCLEGQRLIAISGAYGAAGTEYRTEIEGFSKIKSFSSAGSGPKNFKVWTKSGQEMRFGTSNDSRFEVEGSTEIRSWGVKKIIDTVGNYIRVEYTEDQANGEAYPKQIEYTGNEDTGDPTYNKVKFVYATRANPVTVYHAGAKHTNSVLLTNVQTFEGSNLVLDYRITYEDLAGSQVNRPRVEKIELCDAAGTCLPPTTFTWQGTQDAVQLTAVPESIAQGFELITPSPLNRYGELNGDGLVDAVIRVPGTGAVVTKLYGSSTSGFMQSGDVACGPGSQVMAGFGLADFNGDGYTDVIQRTREYEPGLMNEKWNTICLNDGTGSLSAPGDYNLEETLLISNMAFADVNGDGGADILVDGNLYLGPSFSVFSTPISFPATYVDDFNGDGCADRVDGQTIYYSSYCNPGITTGTIPTFSGYNVEYADFNGDGKIDFLATHSSAAGSLNLATGSGTVSHATPSGWGAYDVYTGDFNGDGRADVALIKPGLAGKIHLSTGTGFAEVQILPTGATGVTAVVADWDSDGADDLWLKQDSGDEIYFGNFEPEVISTVSNGLGIDTDFTYDRLNEAGTLYTKDTDATNGDIDIIGPYYVVSEVKSSDGLGTGGTYDSSYSYVGLKANKEGRGFLGFRKRFVNDPQTGIVQETTFRQDWPYIGLASQETKSAGAQLLNQTDNTYAADDLGSGRRFVKMTQTVQASNDLNGAGMPTVTTTYQYDAYGNPTVITVSTPDGSTKTTTNTYTNNTTNWFLGRLTNASVTSTVPDTAHSSNLGPTAFADSRSIDENSVLIFDPRENDRDPNGDPITISTKTDGTHGLVEILSGGTELRYTPNADYEGTDSFTYTISDGALTSQASVNVTMLHVNYAPVAVTDALGVSEGGTGTFDPRTNDSDPDGDAITITAKTDGSNGTVEILSGGTEVRYTPNAGFFGADNFTYTISDPGSLTAVATVDVTVSSTNQAPTAVNDNISLAESSTLTFDPRTNDWDADSDPVTITVKTEGTHGTVEILSAGTELRYTPTAGYNGSDSFTYTIEDPEGASDTATVNVTVTSTNQTPIAANDAITLAESTSHTFDPRTNDSDPDGDPITIAAKTDGANGTVTLLSGGTQIQYTPTAGFNGADSFTYTIEDPEGASDTATVSVSVTSTNQPPDAVNDSFSVSENSNHTFDPRANDTDPDNDTLTVTAKTNGSNGTVEILSGGAQIKYTPNSDFFGSDSFTYTVEDPDGASDSATVSVTVNSTNQAPNAVNDAITTDYQTAHTFDPRGNDSDPDGDSFTITAKTNGSHGTVTILSGGTQIQYTPGSGYSGSDSFTYTVSDPEGSTDTATVSVTISAAYPNAVNDSITVSGMNLTFDPRTNDSDPAGQTLTIVAVTQPWGIAEIVNGGTQIKFTRAALEAYSTAFTYTVQNTSGLQDTATVNVTTQQIGGGGGGPLR